MSWFMTANRQQLEELWSALKCAQFDLDQVARLFISQQIDKGAFVKAIFVLTKSDQVFFGKEAFKQPEDVTKDEQITLEKKEELSNRGIKDIAIGNMHFLALCENGDILSWGSNESGQLGRGESGGEYEIPQKVIFEDNVKIQQIACGGRSSYALTTDYVLYSWGCNQFGQLAIGTSESKFTPTRVPFQTDIPIVRLYACGARAFIMDSCGRLFGSGVNAVGGIGCESGDETKPEFTPIIFPHEISVGLVTKFAPPSWISVAQTSDGTLWTWGGFKDGDIKVTAPEKLRLSIEVVHLFTCVEGVGILSKEGDFYFLDKDDDPLIVQRFTSSNPFNELISKKPLNMRVKITLE